jgi:hypothetical protein
MQSALISPIFFYPKNYFTGDNVAHYLPGKYLWYVCNKAGLSFRQPVDNFYLKGPLNIDYIFYPQQPQQFYFKKPEWIHSLISANSENEVSRIAKKYDFFINLYLYRNGSEFNSGYSPDLKGINLYLVAYTYKAVYEHNLFLDDLVLNDKYREFLLEMNSL